jgi:hypothetical protein
MKKNALVAALAIAAAAMLAVPAAAHRYDRTHDHPLRLVGYALHPVGVAAEFAIIRPIHWIVSQPDLDIIFGHRAYLNDEGTHFEWLHGDRTPSIKIEQRNRQTENRGMVR